MKKQQQQRDEEIIKTHFKEEKTVYSLLVSGSIFMWQQVMICLIRAARDF